MRNKTRFFELILTKIILWYLMSIGVILKLMISGFLLIVIALFWGCSERSENIPVIEKTEVKNNHVMEIVNNFDKISDVGYDLLKNIIIESWISETLEKWESHNLFTSQREKALIKVEYKIFVAEESINVYDFNNGKTMVGIIEKGAMYLGFGVTRFVLEPTDRYFTWFLAVKFQKGAGFWDGLIKINNTEFFQFLHYDNMLFLNVHYSPLLRSNKLTGTFAVVYSTDLRISLIYHIDNLNGNIKFFNSELLEKALPSDLWDNEYYHVTFVFAEIVGPYEFKFRIISDIIFFGYLIWNIQINESNIYLTSPINVITGREWEF
ncbi:MAG: hypothetical protein FWC34_00300 [Bacteroidetes bacterium]|nr:hypothetical protein [Bacteroidota bacterium]